MQKIDLSKLNLSGSQILDKSQMARITGGLLPGNSLCAPTGNVCHTSGTHVYTCSTNWTGGGAEDPNSVEECCCGHYLYDSECEAN